MRRTQKDLTFQLETAIKTQGEILKTTFHQETNILHHLNEILTKPRDLNKLQPRKDNHPKLIWMITSLNVQSMKTNPDLWDVTSIHQTTDLRTSTTLLRQGGCLVMVQTKDSKKDMGQGMDMTVDESLFELFFVVLWLFYHVFHVGFGIMYSLVIFLLGFSFYLLVLGFRLMFGFLQIFFSNFSLFIVMLLNMFMLSKNILLGKNWVLIWLLLCITVINLLLRQISVLIHLIGGISSWVLIWLHYMKGEWGYKCKL